MKNNVVRCEFQLTNCTISICYGKKAFKSELKEVQGVEGELTHFGLTSVHKNHKSGSLSIVIGIGKLKNFKNRRDMESILVHELSHAVTEIMNEYHLECDELRSYAIQGFYYEAMLFLDNIIKEKTNE